MFASLLRRAGQRGQILVVMVGVIVLAVALLALIVDGGNVLSQQRASQTGSDSAAEAGAILLAERFAGAVAPAGGWDAAINAQVQSDRKSTRLNSSHIQKSRMPSSA